MKNLFHLISIFTICSTLHSQAQITVTHTDFAGPGNTVSRAVDTLGIGLSIGLAGPNQTWDFSGAATHTLENTEVLTVAQTPYTQFSNVANMVWSSDPDAYFYLNKTASQLKITGFAIVSEDWVSGYEDDIVLYQFPTNYGNTFTDNYIWDITVDGANFGVDAVRIRRRSVGADIVDAWGTVLTSQYSYDCLRKKRVEYVTDSVWTRLFSFLPFSFAGVELDTVITYWWVANNKKLPIIKAEVSPTGVVEQLTHTLVPGNPLPSGCQAPANPFTDKITPITARLRWNVSTSAHHYLVRGKVAAGVNWVYLPVNNPATQFLNVAGLSNNTAYQWQIRSYCDAAETDSSDWTVLMTFTTGCYTPASTWTTNLTSSGAVLNWDKVTGAEGYDIRGRRVGGGWVALQVGGGNTTAKQVFGLLPGTTYQWSVRAICSSANNIVSDFSGLLNFTTVSANREGRFEEVSVSNTISIYPNPASLGTNIRMPNNIKEIVTLQVISPSGQVIRTLEMNGSHATYLETSEMATGLYFLKAQDGATGVIKMIVSK